MNRRAIFVTVIIAVMSIAGVGGAADTPTGASYFEGVWSGTWDMGQAGQDVTITIGEKNAKGYHKINYEYGFVNSPEGGKMPPGSFVFWGKEQDGVFSGYWKSKGQGGAKRTVTLKKFKEDEVKAQLDLEGTISGGQRPYYNAILKRR